MKLNPFESCSILLKFFLFFFFKVAALLHALNTVHCYKKKKAHVSQHAKHKVYLVEKKKMEEAKLKRQKEARKKLYRMMGQMDHRKKRSSLKGTLQEQ